MTRWPWRVAAYAVLLVTVWVFLAPLLWLTLTSVKGEEEVYGEPDRWLPRLPDPTAPAAGRRLLLGRVRLLSRDGEECEPGAGLPVSRRWSAVGPGRVLLQ